jgi:Zn-dependent protease
MMVLFGIGYAKPVPVNPRNFRNYRRDDLIVSVAGVTVNLILFLLCLSLAVGVNRLLWTDTIYQSYLRTHSMAELISPYQGNIGSWIAYAGMLDPTVSTFFANPWLVYVQRFLLMMSVVNLGLAVFNLLPIPPLDGFHVLNDIVLKGRLTLDQNVFQITRIALMFLMFTGVLGSVLSTVNSAVYGWVLHGMLLLIGAA